VEAANLACSPINYKKAIVTYFDILGFKQLVESSKKEEVSKIYQTLSWFHYGHCARWIQNNAIFKFSDSLVRVIFLNEDEDDHFMQFCGEVMLVADIIEDLFVDHGIVIRGGMAIGHVFASPILNILFGEAMNRAVELESKVAKFPRVMVDDYRNAIRINTERANLVHGFNVSRYYLKKERELYYIANLRRVEALGPRRAELQKERIAQGLIKYKAQPRIHEKYKWMADEHNHGIDEIRNKNNENEHKKLLAWKIECI